MPIQQWSEGIWVARLLDEPVISEDLTSLFEQLRTAAATPSVVIDLAGTTQVNSSNLSQLLRVRKLMIDRDCRMRIAGPTNTVWAVFMMTGLDKVFEFSPDVSTALAALQLGGK